MSITVKTAICFRKLKTHFQIISVLKYFIVNFSKSICVSFVIFREGEFSNQILNYFVKIFKALFSKDAFIPFNRQLSKIKLAILKDMTQRRSLNIRVPTIQLQAILLYGQAL